MLLRLTTSFDREFHGLTTYCDCKTIFPDFQPCLRDRCKCLYKRIWFLDWGIYRTMNVWIAWTYGHLKREESACWSLQDCSWSFSISPIAFDIISLNLTSLDEQGVILSSYENSDVDWTWDYFFLERVITLWNKLDEQTVASSSLNCFKSNLTRWTPLFKDISGRTYPGWYVCVWWVIWWVNLHGIIWMSSWVLRLCYAKDRSGSMFSRNSWLRSVTYSLLLCLLLL